MRGRITVFAWIAAALAPLTAQSSDPAIGPLEQAYRSLHSRDYDLAVESFRKAVEAAPARGSIRKDLAYTYLKVGRNEAAREQFAEAVRLDPQDLHVALEYAFLCHEAGKT
ncbi:MAG: tetratricopeptide repeat protein, partial [Bryobacterales bacterium]|nr:tetratricopeptide repeat protein [Bryobacterales bacterium]